jgi:hypothetical protein
VAKPSQRRSDKVIDMPQTSSQTQAPMEAREGDIASRAYELYCERGCEDGHDMDDWLQAERDVRDRQQRRPDRATA